jgi:NADP-dependent 3-hydroxy acid dehydrogenase YdfG
MRSMQSEQAHQEDDGEMIEMNIKAFLEATRIYLQQLIPAQQPALATIPVRQRH